MSVVSELLEAIEANPGDEASQLVIADYLQADGDPRGDLIVLDHAERHGMLDDPEALDQLLWLAAEYSFPRAEPADPPLPFTCHSRRPTRHELLHDERRYLVVADENEHRTVSYSLRMHPVGAAGDHDWHHHRLWLDLEEPWREDEERVVITIVSDAIRAQTPLGDLRFPYYRMPLPQYEGSPLRCYLLPLEYLMTHDVLRNRFGLAARDYHRWHAIWQRLRAMQPR